MTEEIKKREVNLRVRDGEQFYANETAINMNPSEIVFDFKCISQVQDVGNHPAVVLKHNVVIMVPFHAKSFATVLNKAVKDYEDKFGKIEKTKQQKKADVLLKKETKKDQAVVSDEKGELYFG